MSAIALLPLVLVVLLGLGGLAAAVYAIVYAVVNKRPGIALAAVLVPVAVLLCVGVIAALFFPVMAHDGPAVVHAWSDDQTLTLDVGTPHVGFAFDHPAPVRWIVVSVLAIAGISLLMWKRPHPDGKRRGGWAVRLLLIGLVCVVFWRLSRSPRPVDVARITPPPRAETEMAAAKRHMEAARRNLEAAGQQAGENAHETMQELWDQLNQPRIPVEAVAEVAGDATDSSRAASAAEANSGDVESVENSEVSDALANQAERVARLARLLAAVATQVSDVASAVGRGFVASEQPQRTEQPKQPDKPEVAEQPEAVEQVEFAEHVEPAQSVETQSAPSKPRPAWVDDPPKRVGAVSREVIVAGDYATDEECYKATDVYLLLTTYEHLLRITETSRLTVGSRPNLTLSDDTVMADGRVIIANGRPVDYRLNRLALAGIGIDFIRREIAKDEYMETVQRSFGPMKKLYTKVEFSPSVDRDLQTLWDAHRRQERFAVVGVGAGSVLGLVGLIFGLLKVDTWTKGYYTKRLFLGVPAAIISLVALLALVVS